MELRLDSIHKSFGTKKVLQGISFSAFSGDALGLLGRNGAGKTTAIRIIMGVFPADSGSILVDGEKISKAGKRIGYLPEERGLYPKRIILEQMIYFGLLRGMNKSDAKASAGRWLERLGILDTASKPLSTLSKGNQQKIQLAVALLADPEIIILDEPFSGLDPVNANLLKDIVTELISKGKIVIFSSHQMSYVEQFCDSVAMLHDGEIVLSGDLRSIKRSYSRNNILVRFEEESIKTAEFINALSENKPDFINAFENTGKGTVFNIGSPSDKDKLLAMLAGKNLPIERFEILEPSLEEIFIEKAGD